MKAKIRYAARMGLFVAIGMVGASAVWMFGLAHPSPAPLQTETGQSVVQTPTDTRPDIEALNTQMDLVSKRIENMDQRLSKTAQQMTLFHNQLDQIVSMARSARPTGPATETKAAAQIKPSPETPEKQDQEQRQAAEQAQAKMQVEAELIDDIIHSEPLDREWKDSSEIVLVDTFLSEKFRPLEVIGTECSGTLCRVRFNLNDLAPTQAGMDKLTQVLSALPWTGESWLKLADTEPGEAILYLAREGYSLPR